MRRFFANFPIPIPNIIALLGGLILQSFVFEWGIAISEFRFLGVGLIIVASWLIVWAVAISQRIDIDNPGSLLIDGPYAFSRNPMYIGWFLLQFGIGLVINNVWVAILAIPALIVIHIFDVSREEKLLEDKFGKEYEDYRARVKRYL